jgi:hypothetical protein
VENGALTIVPENAPADHWRCLRNDRQGNLWMLGDKSIGVRRATTGKFEALPPIPFSMAEGFTPLLGDPVLELAWNGDVIASTLVGLCQWDGKRWRLIDQRSGLLNTDITALLANREGSLWVGRAGLGLARWLGYAEWETGGAVEGLPNAPVLSHDHQVCHLRAWWHRHMQRHQREQIRFEFAIQQRTGVGVGENMRRNSQPGEERISGPHES